MDIRVKVVNLEVKHFKRIEEVSAALPSVGIFVVGGKNQQGKTSTLDALAWACGGDRFRPTDPNRGMETAEIRVELSNGLTVERKGKSGALKIIGGKSVQATLDAFISEFALQVPKFMAMAPTAKAQMLLDQFPGLGKKLEDLNALEKKLSDDRLILGREWEKKDKHAKDLPHHDDVPEELLTNTEMLQKIQTAMSFNAENEAKRRRVGQLRQQAEHAQSLADQKSMRVRELERMLSDARVEAQAQADIASGLKRQVEEASAQASTLQDQDVSTIKAQLAEIDVVNGKIRQNLEKQTAEDEAASINREYEGKTGAIDEVRRNRLSLLESVKLPLPGLSIENGELVYNGCKWDCMAQSERYRVAVACCANLKPSCGFVLLDNLECMDMETLREFDAWLKEHDLQGIGTKVSTGPECNLIIEDGEVVSSSKLDAME